MEINTQTAPDPFNLAGLIINQDYLQTAGTTKLLTTVKVGKPNRQDFFRINPDPAYRASLGILEVKEDRAFYIVSPAVTQIIPGEFYAATVFVGANRQGVPFVWPIRLPEPSGKTNVWHQTALIAAETAMKKWVRIAANMSSGFYDIFMANGDLGEPEWADMPYNEILRLAFKNEGIIDSEDHPVIKKLRGN
jgi:hypothetical protein